METQRVNPPLAFLWLSFLRLFAQGTLCMFQQEMLHNVLPALRQEGLQKRQSVPNLFPRAQA